MDKVKEIIKKYKIGLTIALFLLASFFIFLFVQANEDVYENQITVSNPRVNIIDGTANVDGNFDADDEAGNDSSDNNKIVRNFDSLTYEIAYDLVYKEDSTLNPEEKTLDNTRDVIADILIPTSLNVEVSESDYMNLLSPEMTVESNGISYNYYKAEIKDASMAQSNTFDIVLSNINGKNNDIISPIIRVREKTENVTEVTSLMDINGIGKLDIADVRISASEKYGVKLYQGVIKKDEENINSQLPVGIAIYIPSDENRGIRGVQIPNELSFNLNINSNTPSEQSTILNTTQINNYTQDSNYVVMDLPYSYPNNNGNAAVEAENYLNQNGQSSFKIKFSDLKYNREILPISETGSGYYLSTKVFVFSNQRATGYKSDITYNITTDASITNTVSDYLDNYKPFVGDYTSKIDFFNRAVSGDSELSFVDSGKAIYNYNEEFYIQNTINYGTKKGDKLENGFTNYIKIDNTAFKLEDVGNVSDQSKDYYIQFSNNSSENIGESVQYGLGEWTSSYFKLKNNRPSYCPNTLNGISKETLMNLYGGPCIEDNNIIWVDSLQAAADQNKDDKIIIFKLNVTGQYSTGVQTVVRLKAKMVKNYSNIGNTFEIVSRGKTIHNGSDYYLSEIPKVSVNNQTQDLNYIKTTYDNDYNIIGLHKSTGNNSDLTVNIGNTVLVSAFKTNINSISLFDAYGSEKTSFYSGMTDPIEFVVNPIIYKSDYDATITSAIISVYLPEQLEIYEKSSDKKYNAATSGQIQTIDGVNYKVYNYEYSESDINFENESSSGTIPNLHVYAYISPNTPDRTNINVISRISGTLKTNNNSTETYSSKTPIEQRTTSVGLILRNTKDINTIGKTNIQRIDQNGTYTYNMRVANSSSNPAELSLIYIIPYSGDSIGESSNFNGSISVSLNSALPVGYKAYYTKDNSKTILTSELSDSSSVNWSEWNNVSTALSNVTAIKIVPNSVIAPSGYMGDSSGINLNVITKNNKESDKYYNNFYIIQKNADVCVSDDILNDCASTEKKSVSYSSNISEVSVYNRTISGSVFEDGNYNGFYDKTEARLKDIAVDLYKLKAEEFDARNPVLSISEQDELIEEGTTSAKGTYKFDGLKAGNYYVKYTFDCDKYTVTEKNKVDPTTQGDTSQKDSDAQMIENKKDELSDKDSDKKVSKCYAVSNIQTLNNDSVSKTNIDLGLRLRQDFDIKIKKYITRVVVNSNKGTQTYDYQNKTKVKVDVKNLKNTSFTVTYGIEIENTKYFPGTIGSIVETIPDGMTFNPNIPENDGWYESNGNLYYSYLNKSLIMPGEKYPITIVLDLKTDKGGDYINFVAANNLQIKPVVTNFLEVPEATASTEEGE